MECVKNSADKNVPTKNDFVRKKFPREIRDDRQNETRPVSKMGGAVSRKMNPLVVKNESAS